MKTRSVLAFAAVSFESLTAGCAMHESRSPEELIREGKQSTLASEAAVIELLPSDSFASDDRSGWGVFLQCSEGYYWAGHVQAPLTTGVDGNGALRSLARAAEDNGFEVRHDILPTGNHRYALTSATGVYLLATLAKKRTVLDIDSFSPCIRLPDDYIPPRRF